MAVWMICCRGVTISWIIGIRKEPVGDDGVVPMPNKNNER